MGGAGDRRLLPSLRGAEDGQGQRAEVVSGYLLAAVVIVRWLSLVVSASFSLLMRISSLRLSACLFAVAILSERSAAAVPLDVIFADGRGGSLLCAGGVWVGGCARAGVHVNTSRKRTAECVSGVFVTSRREPLAYLSGPGIDAGVGGIVKASSTLVVRTRKGGR